MSMDNRCALVELMAKKRQPEQQQSPASLPTAEPPTSAAVPVADLPMAFADDVPTPEVPPDQTDPRPADVSEPPATPEATPEAPPEVDPLTTWRVELKCPTPLRAKVLEVEARTESEAWDKFLRHNGISGSSCDKEIRRLP